MFHRLFDLPGVEIGGWAFAHGDNLVPHQTERRVGETRGVELEKAPEERKVSVSPFSKTLSVLPQGRPDPDPMSGLISDRMRRVLEEARERFEWVIIDTPPVALLPDANLLSAMVDAAVLVIGAGSTPYPAVERAIHALGRERIAGVVLNRADLQTLHSDYGYYGQYYGHYGQQA